MGYENRLIYSVSAFDGGVCPAYPRHALDPDQSPNAENFDPSVPYVLQKRKGQSEFAVDSTPTGTRVRGLGIFTFEDGTTKIVAKEGTVVCDITAGNFNTAIASHPALADADEVHFTMFTNLMIMTSEEAAPIAPQKWAGSGAFSSLAGSPPAAKYPAVHKGRLYLACTSADPSRVYFSALNNAEAWDPLTNPNNAGDFFVAKGDGMIINGICSDGEVLYVSKIAPGTNEGALYAIYGDGPSDLKPPRRIAWFGATGHRGMAITHSFVVAATHRGIFGLQGNRLVYMNDSFNKDWIALTTAQRAEACVGFYQNQVWVGYPDTGSTNTKAFVCDLFYQRWSLYNWGATARAPRIFATHSDGSLYGAGASTTVRVIKFDTGNTDIDTTAITMFWETGNLDYGQYFTDKRAMQAGLHVDTSQTVTWTVQRSVDNAAFGDSQTVVSNTEGPVKRLVGLGSANSFKMIRYKISEASTTAQGRCFGLETEAELMPRTR